MPFAHLHVHSEYSLLDGYSRVSQLPKAAKEIGQTALALTDHGVMYGAVDFYRACKKEGVKPIIGCEVYVAPRSRFDKTPDKDRERYHMVLLCENDTGYRNLIKMVSLGFTEGFYTKPRIDDELLERYHEGLICLSACLAGEIPRLLSAGDYNKALERARYYQKLFGKDNYFIEIQNHGLEEQERILPKLVRISEEIGAPLVATNDSHYIRKEDAKTHDILLCIQTTSTVEDKDRFRFQTEEFYLKSEEEMRELFPDYPEAIENTAVIAERCNMEFKFGERKLPNFPLPKDTDHFEYFRTQCYEGLRRNYGENPDPDYIERMEYELETIRRMGFVDYFLIVADYVNYARKTGIPVGPGRGSGAGSICAYCTGITEVDPMKYDLLFERFLNPERVSMPDFDIDFSDERRDEVIEYVTRKYGVDFVGRIVTFGTLGMRDAIHRVTKALALPRSFSDGLTALIPRGKVPTENPDERVFVDTIDRALRYAPAFKSRYNTDPQAKRVIDTALAFEGIPHHTSLHAAGVVITDRPVSDYVPLSTCGDTVVTQFTMTTLEELGLLKMDFLGLRNLSIIDEAAKMVRREKNDFDIRKIDYNDPETYRLLSAGDTDGVFQLESAGIRQVLRELCPENIEDVIAVISLYRPGPMKSIPRYIENRHNPSKITYAHPLLEDILRVTYGCIVYQEQVMQIMRSLAGYSFGRADIVRRAMSKKKHDVMEREREIFIHGLTDENGNVTVDGCLRRGVDEKTAIALYDELERFASYAFNKSHAAAYAFVAVQTAWLKTHYKKEFMASLMSSVLGNQAKLAVYIDECHSEGIRVLPPEVNSSFYGFTVDGRNIRFGLLAVRNLGRQLVDTIIAARADGRFTGFYDFCRRIHGKNLNSRALESLIKCGALDGMGLNRRQMLTMSRDVLDDLDYNSRQNGSGQLSLFDVSDAPSEQNSVKIPNVPEFSKEELLYMENEVAGMYLSGHPVDAYEGYAAAVHADRIGSIINDKERYRDRRDVRVICVVSDMKTHIVKKSRQMMAFVTVEDRYGSIELLVFPEAFSKFGAYLSKSSIIEVFGTVSGREEDGEEIKIIANEIRPATKEIPRNIPRNVVNNIPEKNNRLRKPPKLYLRIDNLDTELYRKAFRVLTIFEGRTPVIFRLTETGKTLVAPQNMWVDLNDVMVKELKYQLGDENVVVK